MAKTMELGRTSKLYRRNRIDDVIDWREKHGKWSCERLGELACYSLKTSGSGRTSVNFILSHPVFLVWRGDFK